MRTVRAGRAVRAVTALALTGGLLVAVGPAGATQQDGCAGLAPTVAGSAKDDGLVGTPGPDVIAGLAGNDTIDGRGGDDVICGDDGADTLRGGSGNDRILAGDGGLVPLFESDPEPRGDTVLPGPGDDVVDLGANTVGGPDDVPRDTLDLSDASAGVAVDLTVGTVTGDGSDLLVGGPPADGRPPEVVGTAYADTMSGTPGDDVLVGGDGDDTLLGLAGDDLLLETFDEGDDGSADLIDGGEGDDALFAGTGPDTLLGGPGRDSFDDQGGIVLMDGGPGRDRLWAYLTPDARVPASGAGLITGGPGRDSFDFNVEYFRGPRRAVGGTVDLAAGRLIVRRAERPTWRTALTDVTVVGPPGYGRWRFVGSSRPEVLRATGARVVAHGGGGADRLAGSDRDDVLVGGRGRDRVDGRAGEDRCRAERVRRCER